MDPKRFDLEASTDRNWITTCTHPSPPPAQSGTNRHNRYSFNGVTASPDDDGNVTIDLDVDDHGYRNFLPVMEGWNYVIRMYRPRAEILDGSWAFPQPQPIR